MARKRVTADTDTDQLQDVIRAKLAANIADPGTPEGAAVAAVAGGGGSTPDATASVKGKLQLAGDLGGTAAAPTVPGLAGKAATSHTHTASQVTDFDTAADARVNALVPASSTSVAGKVELATSAETITGTDAVRAVTPAGLAAKVASETVAGIQEFATAAETVSGASGALSVHPAGLLAVRGLYVGINPQTGTTYTPALTDQGKLVTLSNAGAITVSLPQNSAVAFPVGASIDFVVLGAGMATFSAGTGATKVPTSTVTRVQYSVVSAIKIATNDWLVVGDLA